MPPGASEAFYTASDSEQDFAHGIFSLAVHGSKVIVDDVRYSDEPFFQNGVVGDSNRRSGRRHYITPKTKKAALNLI